MTAKPLIVMALESEGQGLLEPLGYEVLYCGVGKVNATYHLTRALGRGNYSAVLNLGSAGSHRFNRGMLVACNLFVQRDMDATGIGCVLGQTPFEEGDIAIGFAPQFPDLPHGVCGSGDSFLQGASPVACDVIDMEAYAFAKVCRAEKIPFAAVKYITDDADEGASADWQQNLKDAAQAFVALLSTTPSFKQAS